MSGATDLWGEWQKHGAQGVSGARALYAEIERVARAGGIASPVTASRGLAARLRYLDNPVGRAELAACGVSRRLLRSWERGVTPSPVKLKAVDDAYWARRRYNLLRSGALKRILDNHGMGRRMEIFPVDQSTVSEKYQRILSDRSIQARYIWDDAVRAWGADDIATLDEIWDDIISELDSDYSAYAYVSAIGIGA
ncbi:hypothetical protein AB0G74_24365 [Streptomyces sp. NPDC020875]|uniref:hypothetical protein n=1 Tax=Streptomyces sp. NPDC020875 TaxID=3154898 RepID=UPI0033DFDD1E